MRRELRSTAATLDQAFEEAARALVRVVVDPTTVTTRGAVHFVCAASDPEALLRAWLDAVRGEMVGRQVILGDFQVHVRDGSLAGVGFGEAADPEQMDLLHGIGAAVITDVSVLGAGQEWAVHCTIDLAPGVDGMPPPRSGRRSGPA